MVVSGSKRGRIDGDVGQHYDNIVGFAGLKNPGGFGLGSVGRCRDNFDLFAPVESNVGSHDVLRWGPEAPVGLEVNAVGGSVRADDVQHDVLEQRAVNVRDLALTFFPR